jgi:Flp pilus assembly protein TadD
VNTRVKNVFLIALPVFLVAACATPEPVPPPVNIEIQEQVGFTITEESQIGGDVRIEYEAALAFLQQGRHEEGIAMLERVAGATPELSAPRIDLGIAQHSAGDLEAAEASLLLALESNPEQPVAHNELGIIYRKTGRFHEARESYESALAVYPGFHYARRNLAILCDLYLGDLECALDNYEAYMETVPSDEEASMWIADIRYRLDQ